MRTRVALFVLISVALGSAALAQRRPRGGGGADAGVAAGADAGTGGTSAGSPTDAGRRADAASGLDAGRAVTADAGRGATARGDAGGSAAAASGDAGGASASATPRTFDIPMNQRGSGTITHYPLPEQLARNDVPVFVQVRSSAPIDHVSLFYRGRGATRYQEVRMNAMGQNLNLPGGYGAHVPCADAFPPAIEYYVEAVATSGAPVGNAGNAQAPISLPIVRERTHQFVPTLPGQPPPRSCGSLVEPVVATGGRDAGAGATGEVFGTADLGEPCRVNGDCRRGLRCGSNRQCVFINPR